MKKIFISILLCIGFLQNSYGKDKSKPNGWKTFNDSISGFYEGVKNFGKAFSVSTGGEKPGLHINAHRLNEAMESFKGAGRKFYKSCTVPKEKFDFSIGANNIVYANSHVEVNKPAQILCKLRNLGVDGILLAPIALACGSCGLYGYMLYNMFNMKKNTSVEPLIFDLKENISYKEELEALKKIASEQALHKMQVAQECEEIYQEAKLPLGNYLKKEKEKIDVELNNIAIRQILAYHNRKNKDEKSEEEMQLDKEASKLNRLNQDNKYALGLSQKYLKRRISSSF